MMIPKAKLVRWDKIISFNDWFRPSQEKFRLEFVVLAGRVSKVLRNFEFLELFSIILHQFPIRFEESNYIVRSFTKCV